jgi:RecJ-like exonuclease
MSPETVSDCDECPDCHGSGEVAGCVVCEEREPAEGSDRCARCAGDGDDEPADIDDEPADIDDDRFTNPYTGACEDDGYDTGSDW